MVTKKPFENLLDEILKTNNNDNYKPKNYSFNLDSFDEEGNQKNREPEAPYLTSK